MRSSNRSFRMLFGVVGLPVLGILIVAWIHYKVTTTRWKSARSTVATGFETDPNSTAEMSRLIAGAAPIHCQPWDIGTGVSGYVWRAPNARAVLLIEHGWGDYAQRYVDQSSQLIPHLLARGVSVYAIDMWGNGRSPGTRGATDLDEAVEDHLAARRILQKQPLPIFVLGHSVGGLVTTTSILREPTGVRGMILVAPAVDWDVSGFVRGVARVGGFFFPTVQMPVPPGNPMDQSRDRQFLEGLERDPLYHSGKISWVTAASGSTMSHENWNKYRQLIVPVLAVTGTGDRVSDPKGVGKFIEAVGSSDKTLSLVEGGRHSLLDDPPANAEALKIILEWLDRRLPAERSSKP